MTDLLEDAAEAAPLPPAPSRLERIGKAVGSQLIIWFSALGALCAAIVVTPAQTIHVFGQYLTFKVSTPDIHNVFYGPAVLEEFGRQRPSLNLNFPSLVRPLVSYTEVTRSTANGDAISQIAEGRSVPGYTAADIKSAFIGAGWKYFVVMLLVAVGLLLGVLAVISLIRLLHKDFHRQWLILCRGLVIKVTITMVVIMGASIGLGVKTGYDAAAQPTSIANVFGITPLKVPAADVVADKDTEIAVLGDSVPAGEDLAMATNANPLEQACHRSIDSFGADLGRLLHKKATNLACSSATIPDGVLASQTNRAVPVPPQFGALEAMPNVKLIVINVGADDVDWATIFKMCYAMPECSNTLISTYFERNLAVFTDHWRQLLDALKDFIAKLDHQVAVVINTYYNPLSTAETAVYDCNQLIRPSTVGGLNADKAKQIASYLGELNDVLKQGAEQYGYSLARVDFSGHQMCDGAKSHEDIGADAPEPYVQGLRDPGSTAAAHGGLHPTAAGQLMIAGSVQAALPDNWPAIAKGLEKSDEAVVAGQAPSLTSPQPHSSLTPSVTSSVAGG